MRRRAGWRHHLHPEPPHLQQGIPLPPWWPAKLLRGRADFHYNPNHCRVPALQPECLHYNPNHCRVPALQPLSLQSASTTTLITAECLYYNPNHCRLPPAYTNPVGTAPQCQISLNAPHTQGTHAAASITTTLQPPPVSITPQLTFCEHHAPANLL